MESSMGMQLRAGLTVQSTRESLTTGERAAREDMCLAMQIDMWVIGWTTSSQGTEPISIRMEECIWETGRETRCMERESTNLMTAGSTLEAILMTRKMDSEFTFSLMAGLTWVTGSTESRMKKE
jgi:hypothetical protein